MSNLNVYASRSGGSKGSSEQRGQSASSAGLRDIRARGLRRPEEEYRSKTHTESWRMFVFENARWSGFWLDSVAGFRFAMKWTPALLIVYVNILLYAVCYQLQRPIEPFLVDKLSSKSTDSKQAYGQLQSFFSTAPSPSHVRVTRRCVVQGLTFSFQV